MSVVSLDIHVEDPDEVVVIYNTIQIWRSPDESGSPTAYYEIADVEQTAARVDGTIAGSWNVSGQTLSFTVDDGPIRSVLFSGSNPRNLIDIMAAINEVVPSIASEVGTSSNKLRLTSPTYGTSSSIVIQASAAATALGLSTVSTSGKGSYPLISATTEEYQFIDYSGRDDFWYKTRFYNTETEAASDFSDPRRGGVPDVLPSSSLLLCFLYLADGAGKPIIDRRIMIVPTGQVQITNSSSNIYTILPSIDKLYMTTNEEGYAEIQLIRGQTFKIFIEGTTFQREVTIPSVGGSSLNLMTAASTSPDPFTIVESPPFPIRMS